MICRMTEWKYYDKADRHQIAYEQLASARSQQMVRLLGYNDKDATTVDACLRCHALPQVGNARRIPSFLAEGVTCIACHGPYREWVEQHSSAVFLRLQNSEPRTNDAPKDWLDFDRKYKEKVKGMTDLWDPVKRTEVCVSCHVGNYQQKKIITHEMYAAGHPPLPSFEPANFSDFMPRHWEYLYEKKPEQRKRLQLEDTYRERAELAAISGPVVLRESMRLFAEQAKANKDEPRGALWPDFARYDCRACHHDLRSDTISQPRASSAAPGRPGPAKWTRVLPEIGIAVMTESTQDAAEQRKHYEALTQAFDEALSAAPFGDKDRAIAAAENLANWADELIKNRSKVHVNQDRARQLLEQLNAQLERSSADFDSARQMTWAYRAIYDDYARDNKQLKRDPKLDEILCELEKMLQTNLHPSEKRVPVESVLKGRLKSGAKFNPARAATLFSQLKERSSTH
jgi:hypothetical protein